MPCEESQILMMASSQGLSLVSRLWRSHGPCALAKASLLHPVIFVTLSSPSQLHVAMFVPGKTTGCWDVRTRGMCQGNVSQVWGPDKPEAHDSKENGSHSNGDQGLDAPDKVLPLIVQWKG